MYYVAISNSTDLDFQGKSPGCVAPTYSNPSDSYTIHIAFRYNHEDAMAIEKSFMYGPSTSNSVCQNKAILGLE